MFRIHDAATFYPYHGEPCHHMITPLHDRCNPSLTGFHHHLVHRRAVATDAIRSRQSIEPKRKTHSQRVREGGGSNRRSHVILLGLVRSMTKPDSVSDCNCDNKRVRTGSSLWQTLISLRQPLAVYRLLASIVRWSQIHATIESTTEVSTPPA